MKRLKTGTLILLASLCAVPLFVADEPFAAAHAQNLQSCKVTGLVLDPNGARIAGATIKVWNADFKREVLSDDEGRFEIEVPPGTYQIMVESDGFKKFRLSPFHASAGGSEHVKVRMKVKPSPGTLKV